MANDPVWVHEALTSPAIGYATPVTGITVMYGGASADISTVGTTTLTLSDNRIVSNGQHPGAWPKVLRSNLDSVRGPNWPSGTGDVEVQGADATSFGSQTLSKGFVMNSNGTVTTIT